MANDSKRISQLGITTSVSANDRVVVVTNPGTAYGNTQTINLTNFIASFANSFPVPNTSVRGTISLNGNTIGSNATGGISVNVAANYIWSNSHQFLNIINGTANNVSFVGSVSAANVVSNSQLSSNLSSYQTAAGLNANVAAYLPTYSGVVNGSSHTVSTSFTANSTLVNAASINIVNQVNTATLYATTSANVGTYFTVNSTSASKTVNATFSGALTSFTGSNTYIQSNTLNLGTSTIAANGYTYLPNGLKMNWGSFVCNTTSRVTFSSPFATALVSLTTTPNGPYYVGANAPYIFASNTTTANIYSVSTTTTNTVYYVAIGY
ncbi:hypothetical protein UFOVP1071_100 [uncultured Caudovirales phage]|uniref:Putative tail fiber protein gp53-like C-terminal domain-containing protein n=1 Tax=uncultured Caudovirales phage TaxID=2100421 RepID=A0A6J5QB79_9CAUD|nr:hypothetical protein UFOVP1071_100 [uncultured Caudovirales phage]